MSAVDSVTVAEGENIRNMNEMGINHTTISHLCELACGHKGGSSKNSWIFWCLWAWIAAKSVCMPSSKTLSPCCSCFWCAVGYKAKIWSLFPLEGFLPYLTSASSFTGLLFHQVSHKCPSPLHLFLKTSLVFLSCGLWIYFFFFLYTTIYYLKQCLYYLTHGTSLGHGFH